MTKPSPVDPIADTLPGVTPPRPPADALEEAVDSTLAVLTADGLLGPRHAALAELCRTAARAVRIGIASRRASSAALAMKELREALAMLPEPPDLGDAADEWEALSRRLSQVDP